LRINRWKRTSILGVFTFLFAVSTATAAPFTDRALFLAAIAGLPGSPTTLDFESFPGATIPSSGGSIGGITFTSSTYDFIVSTGFSTTSGAWYLGLDDAADEVFVPPHDLWSMSFSSPLRALGLYFISSDELLAGDIVLETPIGTAANGTSPEMLTDGGLAYFIGLVSETAPFGTANVTYGAGVADFFVYDVDDITTLTATPVPEPTSFVLTSSALALMWTRRRSTRQSKAGSRACVM
jgi:hypothetical protein